MNRVHDFFRYTARREEVLNVVRLAHHYTHRLPAKPTVRTTVDISLRRGYKKKCQGQGKPLERTKYYLHGLYRIHDSAGAVALNLLHPRRATADYVWRLQHTRERQKPNLACAMGMWLRRDTCVQ